MIDDTINKIVTEVTETDEEFIFTTILPWCEEKLVRKISKQDLVNALTKYFKPMTNFEKWMKHNVKYDTIQSKRIEVCKHYAQCSECILFWIGEGDCTSSNPKVRAWFDSEANT